MRDILFYLVFFVGLATVAPCRADTPVLTWAISATDTTSEKFKIKMMNEKHPLFELLKKNLPEYRHEFFYGTVNRIENELKKSTRTCYLASTALESRLAFSYATPFTVLPSPLLVIRKDTLEKIQQKDKNISLDRLVKDKDLEGIFIENRSYGDVADKILAQKENHLKRQVLAPIGANTSRMIQSRRADYTLEFIFVIEGLKNVGQFGKDLVALPLSDLVGGLPMYVACSRTPEGLQVVTKIDGIVQKHVTSPEYRESMLSTVDPGEQRKPFEKEVDQFIKFRSKGPEIH